jgi:hypothetical protein
VKTTCVLLDQRVKLSMFLQHMMSLVKKLSVVLGLDTSLPFFPFLFKELYIKSIELACGYMPDNYLGIFYNILCGFSSVRHAINQKKKLERRIPLNTICKLKTELG